MQLYNLQFTPDKGVNRNLHNSGIRYILTWAAPITQETEKQGRNRGTVHAVHAVHGTVPVHFEKHENRPPVSQFHQVMMRRDFMPNVYLCDVVNNERLTDCVHSITISCPEIAATARAGQFINVKCGMERLLRRPISICSIDEDEIRMIFEIKGEGTLWLSRIERGEKLDVFGPLGNGFRIASGSGASNIGAPGGLNDASVVGSSGSVNDASVVGASGGVNDASVVGASSGLNAAPVVGAFGGLRISRGKAIVVGGGIGVPPLLFAAETLRSMEIAPSQGAPEASSQGAPGAPLHPASSGTDVAAILGFRDSRSIILKKEFESVCKNVYISTDDGSSGIKGNVIGPLAGLIEEGGVDAVLACGPRVMLKAVAEVCALHEIPCQVSMEEYMGCGVGACLVCACATTVEGVQTMSRVCKDGPVFAADEVFS